MALTHQGAIFGISTTPITPTLDLTAFEALTYEFSTGKGVVTAPSFSVAQNILTQNTLDTQIAEKQVGVASGEDSELTMSHRAATDVLVTALNAAARSQNIFGVSYELNDSLGANGTTYFAAAILGGGGGPVGGGVEDFANLRWSISLTHQYPVIKAAA